MPNPNPKTDQIAPYKWRQVGEEPLADKPLTIRLPRSVDAKLRAIPADQRSRLIRWWIAQGLDTQMSELEQANDQEH